jgi:hypothetical protein
MSYGTGTCVEKKAKESGSEEVETLLIGAQNL